MQTISLRKPGGDVAERCLALVLPALVLLVLLTACEDLGSAITNDLDQPVDFLMDGVGDCAWPNDPISFDLAVGEDFALRCSLRELTSFAYRTPDGRVCQADMANLQRKATKAAGIPHYSDSDWNIRLSELTCVEPAPRQLTLR